MLTSIDHWLNQWGHPIWEGIYLCDREACEQKLTEAKTAINEAFSTPDAESAAALYLDFLHTQTLAQFEQDTEKQAEIRLTFIRKLDSCPPSGELHLVMWARTLLTIRCLAHQLGISSITEMEVSNLIEHIPVDDLDHQSLSYLAFWAFHSRNKYYLDYTFRLFLTDPFVFMVDFSRQRIRVMRALIYGNCIDVDIAKLIDLLPHKIHVDWFEDTIIPECQAQNLWTPDMAHRFVGKSTGIDVEGPKIPSTRKQTTFELNF